MANLWVDSVKHCVGNLTRFSGRDRAGQFWPYAGTVVAIDMIVWIVAVSMAMNRVRTSMLTSVETVPPPAVDGGSLFSSMALVMSIITLVTIALVAAAVVRRLHDRGKSGWWGLLPVPFLLGGLVGMPLIRSAATDGNLPSGLFMLMGLNNLVYLVSLVVLIVMLARSGEPRDNRYGSPPVSRA